jgi:hypothetical protein
MYIVDRITDERRLVHILPIENDDFKQLTVKRYSFNWKKLKNESVIYKLTLVDDDDILGLIGLVDYPAEERTEIKLLASSAENMGKEKKYERIAGCLIAFAGREAIRKFKNYPALSLIPKTELRQHYIRKYGMVDAGWQLYLEDLPLLNLIKEYLS